MRGNPNLRPASVHPFHRSGDITNGPRPGPGKTTEQQVGQTEDGDQAPAPPAQARQQELAAELADFLWKRQEPGLDQLPSSTKGPSGEQESGIWRDQLLAEIEGLAATLKEKVARYSLTLAPLPSEPAAEPANETAVLWIQDALEDIAATALGIELASRALFIQAASSGEQDSTRETTHGQTAETAE